jgi:hypothetical protein
MMFELPAACFAMWRAADRDNKKSTGAIMGSSGFTSFLTGITEPIEFSFMFAAPANLCLEMDCDRVRPGHGPSAISDQRPARTRRLGGLRLLLVQKAGT